MRALLAIVWATCAAAVSHASLVLAVEPPYQALARRTVGVGQGVYAVAADGTVLASEAADRPVHPASVSKIPTTTALLHELGPNYRFATTLRGIGGVREGAVWGDLVVDGSGDPFLVAESAALILAELSQAGVDRVGGSLRVHGDLFFNWKPDPGGRAFELALSGRIDPATWRAAAARLGARVNGAPTGLAFENARPMPASVAPGPADPLLLVHLSPSLQRILKELNGYSNNVFHPLSERIGGPAAVERLARASVPSELADEIVITNAAGAGTANRISPRASVALVRALDREVARHGLTLADVLPVAGVDRGTLDGRFDEPDLRGTVVGKTGTYGSLGASALAGVARTRRWGDVTFAILNRDVPVDEARRRQNAFVTALLHDAGPVPLDVVPVDSPILVDERIETRSGG